MEHIGKRAQRLANLIKEEKPKVIIEQECRMLFEVILTSIGTDVLFNDIKRLLSYKWEKLSG